MKDTAKWVTPIIISALALIVASYGAGVSPRKTTLHSERIKASAKVLLSSNQYGWQLGALAHLPDREPFTNGELHDPKGMADDIVKLFNTLDADLMALELIMPDSDGWQSDIETCRTRLRALQEAFQSGALTQLSPKFVRYYERFDALRRRLRVYLN